MIDPHVHFRDWEESDKGTVYEAIKNASEAGIDGVFDMPNTNPALTSRENIVARLRFADWVIDSLQIPFFYGAYAGISADGKQIEEIVNCYDDLFPRVVGLKMFAGQSTGNMGIVDEKGQRFVYKSLANLNYKGVTTVHCEKESLFKPELWDFNFPFTHTLARPPEAEVESVKDQIKFANEEGFKGTLHIAHLSVPESLYEIQKARSNVDFRITCEACYHHLVYSNLMMGNSNLKMNPPLRAKEMQEELLELFLVGDINFGASDYAPHTLKSKRSSNPPSGYAKIDSVPRIGDFLSDENKKKYLHDNVLDVFGIDKGVIPYRES